MDNFLDSLFYLFYSSLRGGFGRGRAERASFAIATSLFLFILSFYFTSIIVFGLKLPSTLVSTISCLLVAFLVVEFNSRFFVKSRRYKKIIRKYGKLGVLTKTKKITFTIIAILIYLGSLVSFCFSGFALGRYLNQ